MAVTSLDWMIRHGDRYALETAVGRTAHKHWIRGNIDLAWATLHANLTHRCLRVLERRLWKELQ